MQGLESLACVLCVTVWPGVLSNVCSCSVCVLTIPRSLTRSRARALLLALFWLSVNGQCPGGFFIDRPWGVPGELVCGGQHLGYADGVGTDAAFESPAGVAYSLDGARVVVSVGLVQGASLLRLIDLGTAASSTVAGNPAETGFTDGAGTDGRFNKPNGVAFSPNVGDYLDREKVAVADSENNAIRIVDITTGLVTTLAGNTGASGSADGAAATFMKPWGISWSPDATTIAVTDGNPNEGGATRIRLITVSTGATSTLAGTTSVGTADGVGTAAAFMSCTYLSYTPDGQKLLVSDGDVLAGRIRLVTVSDGSTISITAMQMFMSDFSFPVGVTMSTDATTVAVVDNQGSPKSVKIFAYSTNTNPTETLWSGGLGAPFGISWNPNRPEFVLVDSNIGQNKGAIYRVGGPGCARCIPGQYYDGEECVDCPDQNSYSLAGSIQVEACTCNIGYSGPNGGTCTAHDVNNVLPASETEFDGQTQHYRCS